MGCGTSCAAPSRKKFPFTQFLLWLAPLLLLLAAVFLLVGGDAAAAAFFKEARHGAQGLKPAVVLLGKYGNIPLYALFAGILLQSRNPERRGGLRFVLCYLVLLALLLMIADTLKIWIGRPRPGEAGEYIFLCLEKAKHSFPSNHVTETAFSALALTLYFKNRPFTIACGVWLAVMAFTRLYLGRHHPTDLLGSALLGAATAWLLLRIARPGCACPTCRPASHLHCPQLAGA